MDLNLLRVCTHGNLLCVRFSVDFRRGKNAKSQTQIFPLLSKAKHFILLEPVIFYELQSTPGRFPSLSLPLRCCSMLFVRLKWSVSVALTTARKHISSFFTMPHKTPRNILLSYFSFSPFYFPFPPDVCICAHIIIAIKHIR